MVQAAFKLDAKTLRLDDKRLERWVRKEQIQPLTRYGMILQRAAVKSIKVVAPTKALRERAKSDDPRKRQRAQKQIQKKESQQSAPGSAPFARTRDKWRTIRRIQYAYDTRKHAVIVGPVKTRSRKKDVPKILEGGGTATIYRVARGRSWLTVNSAVYAKWKGPKRVYRVAVQPRPTMGLAFRGTADKLPKQFKGR